MKKYVDEDRTCQHLNTNKTLGAGDDRTPRFEVNIIRSANNKNLSAGWLLKGERNTIITIQSALLLTSRALEWRTATLWRYAVI
jgi:hypothetical protein